MSPLRGFIVKFRIDWTLHTGEVGNLEETPKQNSTGESERRQEAERLAREEAERRQAIETELERLQAQLANSKNESE